MTDKQPEALSIARRLKDQQQPLSLALRHKAAAKLCRLHEENEAFRAKLSEPEPVAVAIKSHEFIDTTAKWGKNFVEVLNPLKENEILRVYHEPSQREWQSLTDREIMDACAAVWASHPIEVGNVVQDLLKAKNAC